MTSIPDLILEAKNISVTVPVEYSNHTDVSSPDSIAKVPKYTDINDHPIELADDLLSHPWAL